MRTDTPQSEPALGRLGRLWGEPGPRTGSMAKPPGTDGQGLLSHSGSSPTCSQAPPEGAPLVTVIPSTLMGTPASGGYCGVRGAGSSRAPGRPPHSWALASGSRESGVRGLSPLVLSQRGCSGLSGLWRPAFEMVPPLPGGGVPLSSPRQKGVFLPARTPMAGSGRLPLPPFRRADVESRLLT